MPFDLEARGDFSGMLSYLNAIGGRESIHGSGSKRHGIAGKAEVLYRALVKATPKDTGNTSEAWKMEAGGDGAVFHIRNDRPTIHFLEFGTVAHVIVPRHASVLAFDIEGTTIFAKHVNHPGMKPLGFIRALCRKFALEEPEIAPSIRVTIWKNVRIL